MTEIPVKFGNEEFNLDQQKEVIKILTARLKRFNEEIISNGGHILVTGNTTKINFQSCMKENDDLNDKVRGFLQG